MAKRFELEEERQRLRPRIKTIKRIVVCLDGTWNSPDQDGQPTNVVKIMRAIQPVDGQRRPQIAFYGKGIGADGGQVDRVVSGLTGRGLEQDIRDAYRFLAHNWTAGDEIYVFGFSRGAFTGRSLCGFISLCGLLPKEQMDRLNEAWALYEQREAERDQRKLQQIRDVSRCGVKITCLGVWDTVGARGVPVETLQWLNRRHEFHNAELSDMVECAFHALAIDEKRGPFAPTLWQKRKGQPLTQKVVEQVWFPGVHVNVGGGYPDPRLSDLALSWMIRRVQAHTDLAFNERYIADHVNGHWRGEIYESRTALYAVSKHLYPYQRLIGQCEVDGSLLRNLIASVPNISERRNRPSKGCEFINEMIHWSAVERFQREAMENGERRHYAPANLKAALESRVPIADERIVERTADAAD